MLVGTMFSAYASNIMQLEIPATFTKFLGKGLLCRSALIRSILTVADISGLGMSTPKAGIVRKCSLYAGISEIVRLKRLVCVLGSDRASDKFVLLVIL